VTEAFEQALERMAFVVKKISGKTVFSSKMRVLDAASVQCPVETVSRALAASRSIFGSTGSSKAEVQREVSSRKE